jgi:hypothetical protein
LKDFGYKVGVKMVPTVGLTDNVPVLITESNQKTCIGNAVVREVSAIALGVLEGLKLVFIKLGQIQMNANAFGRLLELGGYGYTLFEIIIGKPGDFSHMTQRLSTTKGIVDTVQAFDGVHYFGGPSKKKTVTQSLGNGAMLAACVGGGMEILDKCKLISLGRIAERIGSIPVLGQVTQTGLSFGQILNGLVGFGYSCFCFDAIDRLAKAEKPDSRRQACIEISWFVAEVAAKFFVIFAGAKIGGVIALGSLAAALGIVSYLHGISVENGEVSQVSKTV